MIYVLTGATGSGKSSLAIELAKRLDAEIINGDAFQIYQGLMIATASPSEEEKKQVPHHLFNFLPLDSSYSIAQYQKDCRAAIADVLSRKDHVVIVGGSGLYLRAALYDYDLSLDTDKVDMSPFSSQSNEELRAYLYSLDAEEAEKIPVQNRVRLLRSIRICLASGKSKTSLLAEQKHAPIYPCSFFVLHVERDILYPRVNERVEKMFQDGLLEETIPLIKRYGRDIQAFKAIGVRELFPYIDGQMSLEETKEAIKKNTRHYIKRQETFFRHQFNAKQVANLEDILPSEKAEE